MENTFKSQLETLKSNLPKVRQITIADFLRDNYSEILEVIRLSKIPEIRKTFQGGTAYGQISDMAFKAGITQRNGKPISVSSISTYLTRIYNEKGLTKKSGSNVKTEKTKTFNSLIKLCSVLDSVENYNTEQKEKFERQSKAYIDKFENEIMSLANFNQLCLSTPNPHNRIDKRYKLSIISLAKLLTHFKCDFFKSNSLIDKMQQKLKNN